MAIDLNKPRKILVVHGVQTGTDQDLRQHEEVKILMNRRTEGMSASVLPEFSVDIFRYEDISDARIEKLKQLLTLLGGALGNVAATVMDLVVDVVINKEDGTTAALIRSKLKQVILENFSNNGHPLFLLAHSLGSVYAYDVINELMKVDNHYNPRERTTWPVQGFVTIGSPLGLRLFERDHVENIGVSDNDAFTWLNYWDEQDPIVSGSIFGLPNNTRQIVERFHNKSISGWYIEDIGIDTGKIWIMAHTGYWDNAHVGDALIHMIS